MKQFAISWYDDFTQKLGMKIVYVASKRVALQLAYEELTNLQAVYKDAEQFKEGAIEVIEILPPEFGVVPRGGKFPVNPKYAEALPQYAH